jgi:hypothetical protein
MMGQLYRCIEPFVTNRRGTEVWVLPDQIAEAGSWPLDISPRSFEPLALDYPAPPARRRWPSSTMRARRKSRSHAPHWLTRRDDQLADLLEEIDDRDAPTARSLEQHAAHTPGQRPWSPLT